MRVLIVEDDPVHMLLVRQYLEGDFSVEAAPDGREALALFEKAHGMGDPYRIILLDIEMPFVDGQEALRAIRQREKDLGVKPGGEAAVFMITAHGDQRNVCDSFFHGNATGYLVKPVEQQKLRQALASVGEA